MGTTAPEDAAMRVASESDSDWFKVKSGSPNAELPGASPKCKSQKGKRLGSGGRAPRTPSPA
eukprot:10321322-Lingulodinium_polyedra.AAC.1